MLRYHCNQKRLKLQNKAKQFGRWAYSLCPLAKVTQQTQKGGCNYDGKIYTTIIKILYL